MGEVYAGVTASVKGSVKISQLLLTDSINNDIIHLMPDMIAKIVQQMHESPRNISFSALCKVCDHYFGKLGQEHSSHRIYRTPWQGDPRINIQNDKGKAKAYQVKQVLKAISKLEA